MLKKSTFANNIKEGRNITNEPRALIAKQCERLFMTIFLKVQGSYSFARLRTASSHNVTEFGTPNELFCEPFTASCRFFWRTENVKWIDTLRNKLFWQKLHFSNSELNLLPSKSNSKRNIRKMYLPPSQPHSCSFIEIDWQSLSRNSTIWKVDIKNYLWKECIPGTFWRYIFKS